VQSVEDLDRELAAASSAGKAAMLDFSAEWCVSCKEMEKYTFSDGQVQAALGDVILLRADVTANNEHDQALFKRFGIFGPPTIAFFGPDGVERREFRVVGYVRAEKFRDHIVRATANPRA
jgi:thiol:disulfide interchange protein DsbD